MRDFLIVVPAFACGRVDRSRGQQYSLSGRSIFSWDRSKIVLVFWSILTSVLLLSVFWSIGEKIIPVFLPDDPDIVDFIPTSASTLTRAKVTELGSIVPSISVSCS